VNREGGARLKLPNLWRAMDITSGEKARFALRRGERERESEREEVGGWGGERRKDETTAQAIGCTPAGRDAT